jgi:2-iminobutanoate/2-iminopropanoate deaminase
MKKKYELGGGPGMPPSISKNYSNGVKVGNFIFTAGQAALNEKGELVGANDIRKQTDQTLKNIEGVIKSLGASLNNVVKVTVWLKDFSDYQGMNEIYVKYFEEPRPVRACVRADLVPIFDDDLLVEIEATAAITD